MVLLRRICLTIKNICGSGVILSLVTLRDERVNGFLTLSLSGEVDKENLLTPSTHYQADQ